MPNVRMPNGDVVAFPDDMPREQIKGLIATKFPDLAKQGVSGLESGYRGFEQGATAGFGDEIKGGIGAAFARTMRPDLFKDQSFSDTYTQGRNMDRTANKSASDANPWTYGLSNVAGSVATGSKIPLPTGTAGKYAVGAGLGAAAGYGNSNSDLKTTQGIDALTGGALGAGGMYLGNKIGQGISNIANSKYGQSLQNLLRGGQPADEIINSITSNPQEKSMVIEALQNGATPDQAEILTKAKQFNIPLSRGDVTRTAEQQGVEDLALRGGYGDQASQAARGFRAQQEQALRNAAQGLTENISGTPYADNLSDVGSKLSNKLKMAASADNANVDKLYEGVRSAGDAKIPVSFINKNLGNAFDQLKEYPLDTMPSTRSVMARAQNVFAENEGGQFTAPADLTKIDNFRKFINRASSSVQLGNRSDMAGVQIVKNNLDGMIDNAVEQNLVYGNPQAINQLKTARETAHAYFSRWNANDAVQKIVENDYTPEAVVNLVRGYGQTGGNKQASELVGKLGDILGKDSEEFGLLKQAQLRQVFGKNLDSLLAGDVQKGFSAEEVNKNLTNLLQNNKSLADAYFTPSEQKTLKDFLDVAYRATNRVPGAVNYSNTAPALVRAFRNVANQFGLLGRVAGAPIEMVNMGAASIKNAGEAQKAIGSFSDKFSNPDNPLAVGLRNKITAATSAAGSMLMGGQAGTDQPTQPTKLTITPQDKLPMPSVNLPQVSPQSNAQPQTPDLFSRIIQAESRGNQNAVSNKGAIGVAQIMPRTAPDAARAAGLPYDFKKLQTDPQYNAALGKAYLGKMLDRYNGNEAHALIAYNWGPGNTDKWLRSGANISRLPAETRAYIQKILGA